MEEAGEVKEEVRRHFKQQFEEKNHSRPNLDGVEFKRISSEEARSLIAPFTMEEVEEAVWSCEGNKSPGPDGFNFNFIKACWETIKEEILGVLHQFHSNRTLPKAFTSSFVALIGKKKSPQELGDFRPISLIGCIYKIISKVLASRIKGVLPGIISTTQTAFLKGRQILDGVLAANEVINFSKKKRHPLLLFKVDFEKAYDSVSWGYLDYMLERTGFCGKWRGWMKACIYSGHVSVLVNGSPSGE